MGRIILTALAGVLVVCALMLVVAAYHAVAASRAQHVTTTPAITAAFDEAGRRWRSHMDRPVHRLALTSAEEYGSGNYLFIFDVYHWFGIGSGYATHGTETRACGGGGGFLHDGGFAGIGEIASDDGLRETRAACADDYGPGRIVAPIGR